MTRVVLDIDDDWRHDGFVFDHGKRHVELRVAHVRGRRRDCPDRGAPGQPAQDTKPGKRRRPRAGPVSRLHRGPRSPRRMRQGPAGGGTPGAPR